MTDPTGLIARTRLLDRSGAPDLLAVAGDAGMLFARHGVGFAGRGVAARVPRADVSAALEAIARDDLVGLPGTGPLAFGALPFLPGAPTDLLVPELLVGVDEQGRAWVTTVTPQADPTDPHEALAAALAGARRPTPSDGPSSFTVAAARPPADWEQAVATATARIRAGELDKVVLARQVTVTADAPISVATILLRLSQQYPGCFLYLVDGYCGASPELLVGRSGDVVRAQPMAGTKPRRGDPESDAILADELLASATYRHEHQVTIDAVHDTLLAFSSYVDYEPEPAVVPLANVVHLATKVEAPGTDELAEISREFERMLDVHPQIGRIVLAGVDLLHHAGNTHEVDAGAEFVGTDDRRTRNDQDGNRVVGLDDRIGDGTAPADMAETEGVVAVEQHTLGPAA